MNKDSAVGAFAILELEAQDEVVVVVIGPDDLVLRSSEHSILVAGPHAFRKGGVGKIVLEEGFEFLGLEAGKSEGEGSDTGK